MLNDAPPPVPLGIIEGSAAPVAPVSPRRSTRATAGRSRSVQLQTPAEKPMDRWARIPRPQSRYASGSAYRLSNVDGGGGHSDGGASCGH